VIQITIFIFAYRYGRDTLFLKEDDMQAVAHHHSHSPLAKEEAVRKIKIVMIVPAMLICCAIMFIAS